MGRVDFVYARAGNIAIDIRQKIIRDSASTIVVMKGLATTAGSNRHTLANIGIIQPTIFAMTTVANRDIDTARHMYQV